ncbi:uncharacterized protein LOC100897855 [Galendromus occidentalis]|uniref:Uncharacterized protein LOC100897855 n=1 Tax=Galendromus occidentalis TaxID=34638 RepID=A0AAJ6QYT7_9ACAR|nr:uncharacterized protein LOC100897855 [Galendromus occidentalis]
MSTPSPSSSSGSSPCLNSVSILQHDKPPTSVQCVRVDERSLCIVRMEDEGDFIPLSCFLEWSSITEKELLSIFEECGLEMSKLTTVGEDVRHSLHETPHHSNEACAMDERLLPLGGAIAYLRIFGMMYEAASLGNYLLKEGLLSENSLIPSPC